jgi:hypothetical protein
MYMGITLPGPNDLGRHTNQAEQNKAAESYAYTSVAYTHPATMLM